MKWKIVPGLKFLSFLQSRLDSKSLESTLKMYVEAIASFSSRQRLSHWIVAAYVSQGLECPLHVKAHSTRAEGMSIQDICFTDGWSSQNLLLDLLDGLLCNTLLILQIR